MFLMISFVSIEAGIYDHYPDADTSGDGYISSGEYDEYFY
jgi:hypothetical protein